jgi:hypothetical protein
MKKLIAIVGIILLTAVVDTKNTIGESLLEHIVLKLNYIGPTVGKCFPPTAGLTGWWPGDGNTKDIIGGRSAVLHGDAITGQGLIGQAFVLDGDGDFVDVPHDSAFNVGTGDFTVALWSFFNDTAGEQVLVEKWIQRFPEEAGDLGSEGWTLTKLEGNVLLLATADVSGAGEDVSTSAPLLIPAGTWAHFAATRESGKVTLFMNGLPVAEGSSLLNFDSTSSLKFGHRGNPIDTPGSGDDRGFFVNGRIDEVQISAGKALSQDQIKAIFEAGSTGVCKKPPVLYLPIAFKGINRVCPGGPGTPPNLGFVSLSPNSVPANSNTQVFVQFSFSDPNGDLDGGAFNWISPSGQTVSFPLPGTLAGIASAVVGAPVLITTDSQKGTFKIPIWLRDKAGNCSNIVFVDWTQL